MLFNTLITSVRFLLKSKTYTAINLIGLVLGLTASFILFIFIVNEQSFNKDFIHSDRIFRVVTKIQARKKLNALTPFNLAGDLKKQIPQIELSSRVINLEYSFGTVKIQTGKVFQDISGFISTDPSLFPMLGIKIKGPSWDHLLKDSQALLISDSAAKRIFGTSEPLGKKCKVRINGKSYSFRIEGVFQNLPWNSTVRADFFTGMAFYLEILKEISEHPENTLSSYSETTNETYILLRKNVKIADISSKMDSFIQRNGLKNQGIAFIFQPFTDIYFHSTDFMNDFNPKGNTSNTWIYCILACFILFLAGMNYAILSTARSSLRYKEIGVRKVFGATKNQLRLQIIIESVLLTSIAFPLSILLLGLIDPFMEKLYGYSIAMYSSNLLVYLSIFAGITILIGLFSGMYAAIYLASLDPLFALKMKLFSFKRFTISKFFIVFQLFITLSLLIGFITVYRQITFCLNRDLGLKKTNLLIIHFNPEEFTAAEQLKDIIFNQQATINVSGCSVTPPTTASSSVIINIPGKSNKKISLETYFVDYNFFETMGIKLISGRVFNPDDSARNKTMMLLNLEAVRALGFKDPLAKQIGPFQTIGVVDNFNIRTQHEKIQPAMFCFMPSACQNILVRYKTGGREQLISVIEKSWQHLSHAIPLDYSNFDTELDALYIREKNFVRVVATFTILAFVITGMGMFGLALLITERRRKEIAIRKVFGASNAHIIIRIQREFYFYIGIATLISIPVSWYFINKWLDTFYYHIQWNSGIFAISIFSVFLFVSLILLFRTIKVLREKPIDVLKYE